MVIAVVAAAAVLGLRRSAEPDVQGQATTTPNSLKAYSNAEYGISFAYPAEYRLDERDTGNGERKRREITLIHKDDYESLTRGERSEGPTAITIELFQNDIDKMTVRDFVTKTGGSNFKLSPDGTLSSTTAAGAPALAFRWSGLYEGRSIAFEHRGWIIVASVTYMSPDDAIVAAFESLMGSMTLSAEGTLSREKAISLAKAKHPELAAFPSEGLPPRSIGSEPAGGGWFLSFESHGSGVPFVLDAACYKVTEDGAVAKIGEYKKPANADGAQWISPRTCGKIR